MFSPLLEGGTTHLAVMIIRLMVLLLLSLYVARGILTGALEAPSLRIGPAVLAYLALAVFSTARSPYLHQSLHWLVVLLGYAALLYLLVCFIEGWDHIARLLVVLVGMGLFETADENMPGRVWWRYSGLELSPPALEALYRGNARKLFNWEKM